MRDQICCIFNSGPHYRLAIYRLMTNKLNCSFYFCKNTFGEKGIKQISQEQLKSTYTTRCISFFSQFYFQSGVIGLLFKHHTFIIGGMVNSLSDWLILVLGKLLGKNVYIWTHGWYGKESVSKRLIKKRFYNLAKGIFLYGEYAKSLMILNGFDESKLHIIYNSLDHEYHEKLLPSIENKKYYQRLFGNTYPVIIFTGRLTKGKRLNLLLEALKLLIDTRYYCNILFVGKGEELENLELLTCKLKLNSFVHFYGETYDEKELANLIYNASVTVSPGNVGLTAIHSLSFGTPVITHDNFNQQMPEFEAIKPGKTGDFFVYNNVESLVSTIKNWIYKTDRDDIREECLSEIRKCWNPDYQIRLLKSVIDNN